MASNEEGSVKEGTKRVLVYRWNYQLHKMYVILCSYGEQVVAIAVGPTHRHQGQAHLVSRPNATGLKDEILFTLLLLLCY